MSEEGDQKGEMFPDFFPPLTVWVSESTDVKTRLGSSRSISRDEWRQDLSPER